MTANRHRGTLSQRPLTSQLDAALTSAVLARPTLRTVRRPSVALSFTYRSIPRHRRPPRLLSKDVEELCHSRVADRPVILSSRTFPTLPEERARIWRERYAEARVVFLAGVMRGGDGDFGLASWWLRAFPDAYREAFVYQDAADFSFHARCVCAHQDHPAPPSRGGRRFAGGSARLRRASHEARRPARPLSKIARTLRGSLEASGKHRDQMILHGAHIVVEKASRCGRARALGECWGGAARTSCGHRPAAVTRAVRVAVRSDTCSRRPAPRVVASGGGERCRDALRLGRRIMDGRRCPRR